MSNIRDMNLALFHASQHMAEAAKHLSNVEEFRNHAVSLMKAASDLADIIEPEPEKVTPERMNEILDEIMNFGDPKDGKG